MLNNYNSFKHRHRLAHDKMHVPAFLLWFFRCLMGWSPYDKIDNYNLVPDFIFDAAFDLKILDDYIEYEDFRFGVLDYLLIIPALMKYLFSLVYWKTPSDEEWNTPHSILLVVAYIPIIIFLPINCLLAFACTLVLSPFLCIYKHLESKSIENKIDEIMKLKVYEPSNHSYFWFLNEGQFPEKTINQLTTSIDHLSQFRIIYSKNQEDFVLYSPNINCIIYPHQETKEGIQALVALDLIDKSFGQNPINNKLFETLLQRPDPIKLIKQKTQFEAFFSLEMAFKTATETASPGLKAMVHSKVPEILFNHEIANLAGLSPLSDGNMQNHAQLYDDFLNKNLFFVNSEKQSQLPESQARYVLSS